MKIFDNALVVLRDYLKERSEKNTVFKCEEESNWEKDEIQSLIMQSDSAIEFGHPSKPSSYFMVYIEENGCIEDGKITVVGNDINKIEYGKNPFGQIAIIKGHGFSKENIFERNLELDLIKHHVNLKGCKFFSKPARATEWARVSKYAVENGFSFKTLGSEMIKKFKELEYVDGVEIIFISSSSEDVNEIKPLGNTLVNFIDLNEMSEKKIFMKRLKEYEKLKKEV